MFYDAKASIPNVPRENGIMRFGCCGCLVYGRTPDQEHQIVTGIEALPVLDRLGYDYIELSLSDLVRLDETGFSAVVQRLENSKLECEVCHNFIPSSVRLTGPNADETKALEYVEKAFQRAATVKAEIVVFGSSGARNITPGFSIRTAEQQIVDLLRKIGDLAEVHALTVVVEPLNRRESNIINTLSEALVVCRKVGHPRVKVLCDLYHMTIENESSRTILQAGKEIKHVHISEPENRGFPLKLEWIDKEHFRHLKEIGYDDRISIEAYTENFEADAVRSLEMLRSVAGS